MVRTKRSHFITYLIAVLVLAFGVYGTVAAQEGTGAPPPGTAPNSNNLPSGQPNVPNTPQALPPEGVPGLEGEGSIVIVPSAEEGISYVDVGEETTVYVSTSPTRSLVVRTELEPIETLPNSFPPEDDATIIEGIEIGVYWVDTAEERLEHDPPLVVSRNVPNPQVTLVFLYDQVTDTYTPVPTISDPATGWVLAEINETSSNMIFVWVEIASEQERAAYEEEARENPSFTVPNRGKPLGRLAFTGDASASAVREVAIASASSANTTEVDTVAIINAAPQQVSSTQSTPTSTPLVFVPIALALFAIALVVGGAALYLRKHE